MTDRRHPVVDKSLIGRRSEAQTIKVEQGQLKFFAKATDQRDPVYSDLPAAQAAGYRRLPVPPTFAYSLVLAAREQAALALTLVRADPRYILHAEQGFRNHAMMFDEDEITLTTEILDIYEKKEGALVFIVQRTQLVNQHGELCVDSNTTFVLRIPKS